MEQLDIYDPEKGTFLRPTQPPQKMMAAKSAPPRPSPAVVQSGKRPGDAAKEAPPAKLVRLPTPTVLCNGCCAPLRKLSGKAKHLR